LHGGGRSDQLGGSQTKQQNLMFFNSGVIKIFFFRQDMNASIRHCVSLASLLMHRWAANVGWLSAKCGRVSCNRNSIAPGLTGSFSLVQCTGQPWAPGYPSGRFWIVQRCWALPDNLAVLHLIFVTPAEARSFCTKLQILQEYLYIFAFS